MTATNERIWLTTCLQFPEGDCEGQFFRVGTMAECEEFAARIPAIAYKGARKCVESSWMFVPEAELDPIPHVGECWTAPAT